MLSTELPFNNLIVKMGKKIENANNRELCFTFTLTQFNRLFGKGVCAYSGEEFTDQGDMSIERIDPKIGYTPSNCILVRAKYNEKRGHLDELLKDDSIPDEVLFEMLKHAQKAVKSRITEKAKKEEKRLAAVKLRMGNLSMMANEMKRRGFGGSNGS